MKVLFVINSFYTKGNGLCASARRTVAKLKERGLDVKVLSAPNQDKDGPQPDFVLQSFYIPLFDPLVEKQGYLFAKADKKIIEEAIRWADVVHLEEPFSVEAKAAKIAKKLGKPCTGTYHLHPENLFASVHMARIKYFNSITLRIWRDHVFNRCQIIQCPTENVKERLSHKKFRAQLRTISNGLVLEDLVHIEKDNVIPKKLSDAKYTVITIGRYSVEKDLKTLLKAMKYAKHSNDIQLVIAGRGPQEKNLKRYANCLYKKGYLKYPVVFGFYTLDELQQISAASDLYVHCAYIEVEGLSCMEAIQIGIVPIIADGGKTATAQFAMDHMSRFKQRDAKDLAYKIDYWLANEDKRKEEAKKYTSIGKDYDIEDSIDKLIEMFNDAIEMKKITHK